MLFIDFPTLVRARRQAIAREVEARLLRDVRQTRRPGWITRSLVIVSGKLGTVLVTAGRRLECYAYRIRSQSDGLQAAG